MTDKESKTITLHDCTPCGYVYDPREGDPDGGIPPGTPFDQLPEHWVCPMCGIEKEYFSPFEAAIADES